MNVRDLVNAIRVEIRDTDLSPERAGVLCSQLSALLGNITGEIRIADVEFNKVLLKALQTETKANRARIVAETTPEYLRRREARDTKEVVIEMIRSLRELQRSYREEMRLGTHG